MMVMFMMMIMMMTREVEEVAERKGFSISFEEIWRLRSRDVRGTLAML